MYTPATMKELSKTLQDIFQAAEDMYEKTSEKSLINIRSLAKQAGYSYGTLYKYFKSINDFEFSFFTYEMKKTSNQCLQGLEHSSVSGIDETLDFLLNALKEEIERPRLKIAIWFFRRDFEKRQIRVLLEVFTDFCKALERKPAKYGIPELRQDQRVILTSLVSSYIITLCDHPTYQFDKKYLVKSMKAILATT